MKATALAVKIVLAWIAIFALQVLLGMLLPVPASVTAKNALPWLLLSNLLVAMVISFLAVRSDWRGLPLALALSGIPAIVTLNNYLEGVIFLTSIGLDWRKEILRACLLNAFAIPLWLLIFRKPATTQSNYHPFDAKPLGERVWRFALADLAYPILYITAGMIIFPLIRDFYATQTLPPMGMLLALQFLVRGPILAGICLLMTRMLGLSRWSGAVAVGVALSILNGIAPLIIPSGVFPDVVRWAHFFETSISNFVFGMFVAWLWGKPQPSAQLVERAA